MKKDVMKKADDAQAEATDAHRAYLAGVGNYAEAHAAAQRAHAAHRSAYPSAPGRVGDEMQEIE